MCVIDILCRIERGEITVKDGISLLNETRTKRDLPSGRGKYMKIRVFDGKNNLSFTIPIFLISAGLSMARFGASVAQKGKTNDNANKALDAIGSLDKKDVKLLTNELRKCKHLNFIEVHSGDNHVSISII